MNLPSFEFRTVHCKFKGFQNTKIELPTFKSLRSEYMNVQVGLAQALYEQHIGLSI
jgi:hypothetical protein